MSEEFRRLWIVTFRRHWQPICSALLAIGTLWVVLGVFGAVKRDGAFMLLGLFLSMYSGLLLLSRLPPNVLGKKVDQRLESWVASSGAGFFGLMTLARFVQLEIADIVDALGSFGEAGNQVKTLFWEWLIGFSIDSVMNSITAFMWPFEVFKDFGLVSAALMLLPLWALYHTGARAFPRLHAKLDRDSRNKAADGEVEPEVGKKKRQGKASRSS